jgi:uncharacterized protein YbbK (DUF523 family)
MKSIMISACLLGIQSAYHGKQSKRLLNDCWESNPAVCFIPFCPEQIVGFPTPRLPVEICGGDGNDVLACKAQVVSEDGTDVTHIFLNGLENILTIARWTRPSLIVTQQRSPSCSCAGIYDGTFSHTLIPGDGVVAACLKKNGYQLMDIDDFNKKGMIF